MSDKHFTCAGCRSLSYQCHTCFPFNGAGEHERKNWSDASTVDAAALAKQLREIAPWGSPELSRIMTAAADWIEAHSKGGRP